MIKGLSEVRRLPRLGKLRLGIKKKKNNPDSRCRHKPEAICNYCTYPVEVDYFVVSGDVARVYGDKPKELDVYLPVDDTEKVFPNRLNWYTASRLRCAGDGEKALRIFKDVPGPMKKDYPEDTEDLDLVDFPCPCPLLETGDCKRNGTLNVILPKVSLGGIYSVSTGSVHSIIEINSDIDFVRALLGRASMIPLKLKRVEQKIQYKDQPAKAHWILKLEFQGAVDDVNKIMESKKLLPPIAFALPPPDRVEPAEVYDETSGGKVDPKDDVPEFTTETKVGAEHGDKLDEFKNRQAAKTEPPAEELPKSVRDILAEIKADPGAAQATFGKHVNVINSLTNKLKLMVVDARDQALRTAPLSETEKKLLETIKAFTKLADCDKFAKDKRSLEGLGLPTQLRLGEALQARRREIAADEKEGKLI